VLQASIIDDTQVLSGDGAELSGLKVLTHLRFFNVFGNAEDCCKEAFTQFPEQHECNQWCEWLGLSGLQLYDPTVDLLGTLESDDDGDDKNE
jgi:hypothetical protein